MKFLIVTEKFKAGGAETHIAGFCKSLKALGHEVYLICGKGGRTQTLREIIGNNIFEVDFSPFLSGREVLKSIYELLSLIERIDPDLLHLHPFTSIIYGGISASLTGKPYVVTLHGPQSLVYWYNLNYRLFLEVILRDAWRVFCVSMETLERGKTLFPQAKFVYLPNAVDTERFSEAERDPSGPVALISRLDEDKVPGIKAFLTEFSKLEAPFRRKIHIFGDGNSFDELRNWVREILQGEDWIDFMGHEDRWCERLKRGYAFVAGMGRVVLEAGAMNLPVLLVGYDGPKGFVTRKNIESLSYRNFSGRFLPTVDAEKIKEEILGLEKFPEKFMLRSWIVEKADEKKIHSKYLEEIKGFEARSYEWKEALLASIGEAEDSPLFSERVLKNLIFNLKGDLYLHSKLDEIFREKEELYKRIAVLEREKEELSLRLNEVQLEKEELSRRLNEILSEKNELFNQLNKIYCSDFWKVASFYYRLRERSVILRTVHRFFRWLKHRVKKSRLYARKTSVQSLKEATKRDTCLEDLKEFVARHKIKPLYLVYAAVKFTDTEGQRSVRLSQCLARMEKAVVYVYWNWSEQDKDLYGEVSPGIFVLARDDFLRNFKGFFRHLYYSGRQSVFLIEFPDPEVIPLLLEANSFNFITVYDILDDWEEFHRANWAIWYDKESELFILRNTIYRFAVSKPLMEKFRLYEIFLLPNGFAEDKLKDMPPAQVERGEITIGYFGHLSEGWFDWELLLETAKKNRQFMFHLIGYGMPEGIKLPENIKYFGKQPPDKLSSFVKNWDVCLIPFKNINLSKAVDPIKVYEYLYFKKPVVVTGIPHLAEYPYVLFSENDSESLREAIIKAKNTKVNEAIISEFLKDKSWFERIKILMRIVEG